MLRKQLKKTSKQKSIKRKNPESYNLIFSDNEIEKLSPKQAIQHILIVSEFPSTRNSRYYPMYHTFNAMDATEILEYIHNFIDRYEYLHYNK